MKNRSLLPSLGAQPRSRRLLLPYLFRCPFYCSFRRPCSRLLCYGSYYSVAPFFSALFLLRAAFLVCGYLFSSDLCRTAFPRGGTTVVSVDGLLKAEIWGSI